MSDKLQTPDLNARRSADLVQKIEAIKAGNTTETLNRQEIAVLKNINIQSVAAMKAKFTAEANGPTEKGNEAAHKAYWDGYSTKLDSLVANYLEGLDKITIGATDDLADLKTAHKNMLALKGAAVAAPTVKPLPAAAPAVKPATAPIAPAAVAPKVTVERQ